MQTAQKNSTLSMVKSLLTNEELKKRFNDILGKKSGQFLGSITSLVSSSTAFNDCDPNSIISAALIAATLDLPINPSLGFAYVIPYNSRDGKKAQFQAGYKSFIQLALRSGQYRTINAIPIYEGEITIANRLTGEVVLDETKKVSEKVCGYAAYFRLLNGFEKTLYMTVEQLQAHGRKFSKSYSNDTSLWKTDFNSMALKTVLKMLLSKYGILSVDMQKAIEVDQAVIRQDETPEYVDSNDQASEAIILEPLPESMKPQTADEELTLHNLVRLRDVIKTLKNDDDVTALDNEIKRLVNEGELTLGQAGALTNEMFAKKATFKPAKK